MIEDTSKIDKPTDYTFGGSSGATAIQTDGVAPTAGGTLNALKCLFEDDPSREKLTGLTSDIELRMNEIEKKSPQCHQASRAWLGAVAIPRVGCMMSFVFRLSGRRHHPNSADRTAAVSRQVVIKPICNIKKKGKKKKRSGKVRYGAGVDFHPCPSSDDSAGRAHSNWPALSELPLSLIAAPREHRGSRISLL